MSDRLNFPIWADADTTSTGFTLQHLVNGSWVNTDMRTCALPAGYTNEVCLNRYIEKDIKSTAPNLNVATGITPQPDAYQVYRMVIDGVETREMGFFNDWSYEMYTGNTRCISAPINRHADSRQKLVYGNFAETGNSIIVKEMVQADIKMQPNSISIGAEQYQTITIVVTSNTSFELILPEWLTASQTAFTSGTTVAYLYPQVNTGFDSRQFTIQAKHEGYWEPDNVYTDLAQVAQAGKIAYWTIYNNPVELDWDEEGVVSVGVYTNTDFSATTTGSTSWLTFNSKTGSGFSYLANFNVSANTGTYRVGYAEFKFAVDSTGGTQSEIVMFQQMANPANLYRIYYKASPAQVMNPSVTEGFGAVYTGAYNVGSDYFWAFETAPTAIPAKACAGLAPLRNIIAPESVTSIGYSAFTQTNLTGITAPGVTTIGAYAFNVNKSLKNVEFGNLTSIGECAFKDCSALTSIDLTHIEYLGNYAFTCCKVLSNVEIGSGITYIPKGCFSYCSGLTSMDIPEGVTGMSWDIFSNCYNLSSVTLPSTLIEMGVEGGWGGTFMYAYGLTSLTIPNGVKRIHGSLCYYNSIITAVTIPDSVEVLDRGYLDRCLGLKEITIGARVVPLPNSYGSSVDCRPSSITLTTGVTEIVEHAFNHSNFSATTFYYTGTKVQWEQIVKGKEWVICGTIIHCSDGDVNVAEPVLNYVTTDNNAISPRNATGDSSYCYNIRVASYNFTISNIGGHWDIPDKAFSGYTNLQSVEITNASFKEAYSTYNFSGCTNLESITFGTNVTLIPQGCCNGCSSLTSVTMSNNVKVIQSDAFRDCSALPSVTIPDSVTSITTQAFYICTALSSVTIGSGVTEIGNLAFGECVNLTEINYNNTMAQWENISKGEDWNEGVPATVAHCTDGDAMIWDPTGKEIFYTTTNGEAIELATTAFADVRFAFNTYDEIGTIAFFDYPKELISYQHTLRNQPTLSSVVLPDSITGLTLAVFSDDTALSSVTMSSGISLIGQYCFRNCSALTSITISSSLTKLEYGVFANSAITNITYLGTQSQWSSVTKDSNWKRGCPATVVHCTDGDVPI